MAVDPFVDSKSSLDWTVGSGSVAPKLCDFGSSIALERGAGCLRCWYYEAPVCLTTYLYAPIEARPSDSTAVLFLRQVLRHHHYYYGSDLWSLGVSMLDLHDALPFDVLQPPDPLVNRREFETALATHLEQQLQLSTREASWAHCRRVWAGARAAHGSVPPSEEPMVPASRTRSSQSVAAGGGRRARAVSQEQLRQKDAGLGRPEPRPVEIVGGEPGLEE